MVFYYYLSAFSQEANMALLTRTRHADLENINWVRGNLR